MTEKQVDVRGSFRILHETPGHVTYGVWVNGGKCGDLVVRQNEHLSFQIMMVRGGFEFLPFENRSNQDTGVMSKLIWVRVTEWHTNSRGALIAIAKPEDESLFDYLGYILLDRSALLSSGHKQPQDLKVGDRIQVELIARAFRIFKIEES